MKRTILGLLIACGLVAGIAVGREAILDIIHPARRLDGVWRSTVSTDGGVELPHGAYPIIDFDLGRGFVAYSDGASSTGGPEFTFDGSLLEVLPEMPGEPRTRFRVRFRGRDTITIADIDEIGTLDLVRTERGHIFDREERPEPRKSRKDR